MTIMELINCISIITACVFSISMVIENHKIKNNIIELQCENKQFKDNWNKLKKYMIDTEQIYKKSDDKYIKDMHEIGIRHAYQTILYKMYVLEQGSDSND